MEGGHAGLSGDFVNGTDSGNGDGLHTDDEVHDYQALGASWTLHVSEHAGVGALASTHWGDLRSSTIGPTVGLDAGGLSAVALVGFTDSELVGSGVRSTLIAQYAF